MPATERKLFLLADAGATHARAVVSDSNGAVLGRGSGGAANAFAVGERVAWESLKRSVEQALRSAHVRPDNIAVAVAGSASVDHWGRGGAAIRDNLRRYLPRAEVRVLADALIAHEGAFAGGAGVVIISGTGSIVLGRNRKRQYVRKGGWGPLLGDEGSAQWIARQALQAAARAADGTGPPTTLLRAFRRHYRIPSFLRIFDIVYQHPITPAEIGSLAPIATKAAQSGDARAIEIFRCGGEALGLQAAQAAQELRLTRVSYQGSMFSVGALLLDPLCASLMRHAPFARVEHPVLPPLGGAFLVALRAIRRRANAAALGTFSENLNV